tara:strand:- start:15504 stop:15668 length:165 start_codon:yes stop_codon:yes gene_type:complete
MDKTNLQQPKNEEKKDAFEFVNNIFINKETWGPFTYGDDKRINIYDIVGIYKYN